MAAESGTRNHHAGCIHFIHAAGIQNRKLAYEPYNRVHSIDTSRILHFQKVEKPEKTQLLVD